MKQSSIYILTMIFVLTIGTLYYMAKKYQPNYEIRNLVIVNNQIIPTNVLLEFINITDNKTLSELTAEVIIDRIEKHPYVKKAEGTFIDLTTFKVTIEEIEPFVQVITRNKNFILTKDKKLIPDDSKLNIIDLPLINFTDLNSFDMELTGDKKLIDMTYAVFKNIHQTDIAFFEILSELSVKNDLSLFLYLTKPKGKIIIGNELTKLKAIYLSEFWRKVILKNPVQEYDYIDLRFNNQIVIKVANNENS